MKLAMEFVALVIFFFCLRTMLKDVIHLRQDSAEHGQDHERRTVEMKPAKKLGKTA